VHELWHYGPHDGAITITNGAITNGRHMNMTKGRKSKFVYISREIL
jgi:hypothetical protein